MQVAQADVGGKTLGQATPPSHEYAVWALLPCRMKR
jgi:hypothetical protein